MITGLLETKIHSAFFIPAAGAPYCLIWDLNISLYKLTGDQQTIPHNF